MLEIFQPPVGVFRAVFLYVGQGDSALLIIPEGQNHRYVLVDSNKDEKHDGVGVAAFLKGNIPENELIFVNTHPHKDHLCGIKDINDAVSIGEIWHSGHLPHKENREAYDEMLYVISDITSSNEFYLRGSRELNVLHTDRDETSKTTRKIGDVDYQVFSPAKYVCDEIDGEDAKTRRNRIHEQCGVIKFTYAGKSVMFTGDSDKVGWKEYITEYHSDDLESVVLSASHHGSRTFFKKDEDDQDVYVKHIEKIKPEHLIISAPKNSEHEHPHADALEIYKQYISDENIYYLGEKELSLMVDINVDGNLSVDWVDVQNDNEHSPNSKRTEVLYRPTTYNKSQPYCPYGSNTAS